MILPFGGLSQSATGTFKATRQHPELFGRHETLVLEFVTDSLVLYKRFSGSSPDHCDSIIPGQVVIENDLLFVHLPDREGWVFQIQSSPGFEVLYREDGTCFYKRVYQHEPQPVKPKTTRRKRVRQDCPEF